MRVSAVVLAFAISFGAPVAAEAAERAEPEKELAELEKQLDQELGQEKAALSTNDCNDACRALASIRRATDRICALDPGPRCAAARAKSEEATRRVREACPDCAIAASPLREPDPERAAAPKPANAPPHEGVESVDGRGGCRSCTTTGAETSAPDLAWIAAIAWVLARSPRSRRKDRRAP